VIKLGKKIEKLEKKIEKEYEHKGKTKKQAEHIAKATAGKIAKEKKKKLI